MGEPKEKPVLFTAPPEVLAELREAIAEESSAMTAEQTEAYLRWMETGEGEPWPRERST